MYCATPKIHLAPVGSVFYTAKQRLCDVRSYTTQSPFVGVRYTANWRQVYFALYVLCNSHCNTAKLPFGKVKYTAKSAFHDVKLKLKLKNVYS